MENVATKHGLGSTWRIQCENESCLSHKTNSVFNSSEKSRAFEINRASVLDLRAIGGGHSAASLSFVLISHWFSASLPTKPTFQEINTIYFYCYMKSVLLFVN